MRKEVISQSQNSIRKSRAYGGSKFALVKSTMCTSGITRRAKANYLIWSFLIRMVFACKPLFLRSWLTSLLNSSLLVMFMKFVRVRSNEPMHSSAKTNTNIILKVLTSSLKASGVWFLTNLQKFSQLMTTLKFQAWSQPVLMII